MIVSSSREHIVKLAMSLLCELDASSLGSRQCRQCRQWLQAAAASGKRRLRRSGDLFLAWFGVTQHFWTFFPGPRHNMDRAFLLMFFWSLLRVRPCLPRCPARVRAGRNPCAVNAAATHTEITFSKEKHHIVISACDRRATRAAAAGIVSVPAATAATIGPFAHCGGRMRYVHCGQCGQCGQCGHAVPTITQLRG